MMATVRGVTARFLGGFKSPQTRTRYKKDIVLWQKFCGESGVHPLDARRENCQAFVDWLSNRYSPASIRARRSGVSSWFNALADEGIIPGNGMLGLSMPASEPSSSSVACVPSEDDVLRVMDRVSQRGPRWEWLAGMVAYAGCDVAEALRVRGVDVRTWEGRTLVRLKTRRGNMREVPVDGRLEVLTVGLSQVFAPSSVLAGLTSPVYVANKLGDMASDAVGRRLSVQELRRFAVFRQAARNVPVPVIARWLGHTDERWVRQTLGISSSVQQVTWDDVNNLIAVETDAGLSGSWLEPDLTDPDVPESPA